MTYEVTLPGPDDAKFWFRGGTTHLLHNQVIKLPSSGRHCNVLCPSDFLVSWLDEFTSSWCYFYEDMPGHRIDARRFTSNGLVIGFKHASDAVLFKLTFHECL